MKVVRGGVGGGGANSSSNPRGASNPQENSVLINRSAFSMNYGGNNLNNSSMNNEHDLSSGQIQLSEEYLKARQKLMRSQMAQLNMMQSSTSSQRILKVVNIIGSKN